MLMFFLLGCVFCFFFVVLGGMFFVLFYFRWTKPKGCSDFGLRPDVSGLAIFQFRCLVFRRPRAACQFMVINGQPYCDVEEVDFFGRFLNTSLN